MLNKVMLQEFLKVTKLADWEHPSPVYDYKFPIDLKSTVPLNVNNIIPFLSEEERIGLIRMSILSWLLYLPALTNFNWGWYKRDEESEYRLIEISEVINIGKKGVPYHVNGCECSPLSMVLFLKDNTEYLQALRGATEQCKNFLDSFRPWVVDVPLSVQSLFLDVIRNRTSLMEEVLSMERPVCLSS